MTTVYVAKRDSLKCSRACCILPPAAAAPRGNTYVVMYMYIEVWV